MVGHANYGKRRLIHNTDIMWTFREKVTPICAKLIAQKYISLFIKYIADFLEGRRVGKDSILDMNLDANRCLIRYKWMDRRQ